SRRPFLEVSAPATLGKVSVHIPPVRRTGPVLTRPSAYWMLRPRVGSVLGGCAWEKTEPATHGIRIAVAATTCAIGRTITDSIVPPHGGRAGMLAQRRPLPAAGPPGGALAQKSVHAFLAILGEEVAGDRVPGDVVGLTERHLELPIEDLLTACDGSRRLG